MESKVVFTTKFANGGERAVRGVEKVAEMRYAELEALFMAREDALCEDKPAIMCDCQECPVQMMCEILCSLKPGDMVPKAWLNQLYSRGELRG